MDTTVDTLVDSEVDTEVVTRSSMLRCTTDTEADSGAIWEAVLMEEALEDLPVDTLTST